MPTGSFVVMFEFWCVISHVMAQAWVFDIMPTFTGPQALAAPGTDGSAQSLAAGVSTGGGEPSGSHAHGGESDSGPCAMGEKRDYSAMLSDGRQLRRGHRPSDSGSHAHGGGPGVSDSSSSHAHGGQQPDGVSFNSGSCAHTISEKPDGAFNSGSYAHGEEPGGATEKATAPATILAENRFRWERGQSIPLATPGAALDLTSCPLGGRSSWVFMENINQIAHIYLPDQHKIRSIAAFTDMSEDPKVSQTEWVNTAMGNASTGPKSKLKTTTFDDSPAEVHETEVPEENLKTSTKAARATQGRKDVMREKWEPQINVDAIMESDRDHESDGCPQDSLTLPMEIRLPVKFSAPPKRPPPKLNVEADRIMYKRPPPEMRQENKAKLGPAPKLPPPELTPETKAKLSAKGPGMPVLGSPPKNKTKAPPPTLEEFRRENALRALGLEPENAETPAVRSSKAPPPELKPPPPKAVSFKSSSPSAENPSPPGYKAPPRTVSAEGEPLPAWSGPYPRTKSLIMLIGSTKRLHFFAH